MSLLKNSLTFPGKYSCWFSLFNAAASLIPATTLKNDSSTGVFLCIYQNFKNAKHPRIGKFKGKVRYWSPGPVTLRGKPCDFIYNWSLPRGFTKEYSDFVFRDRYSTK